MVTQTIEKERETTVKQVRLRFLEQAGVLFATDNIMGCQVYCENFVGSVPHDSEAFNDIEILRHACEDRKAEMLSTLDGSLQGILEQQDKQQFGMPAVSRDVLRLFYNGLWEIALRHRLIPSE